MVRFRTSDAEVETPRGRSCLKEKETTPRAASVGRSPRTSAADLTKPILQSRRMIPKCPVEIVQQQEIKRPAPVPPFPRCRESEEQLNFCRKATLSTPAASNAPQYSSKSQKFRVIGKRSRGISYNVSGWDNRPNIYLDSVALPVQDNCHSHLSGEK